MSPRPSMLIYAAKLRLAQLAMLGRRTLFAARKKERVLTYRASFAGLTLLTLAGCSSETLPPALSEGQLKAIAATHFKATVGVRQYNAPVYSDYLIKYLRKTQLFDEVAPLEAFQAPPTFIARVDRGIYGTATIPIFTAITFGIIPTTVDEEHGLEFSLVPSSPPKTPIAIKFSYKGPSTLGWWAVYRALQPNETLGAADWRARFVQSLAWHIVEHRNEISAYAK
jgi:hypothetical protein